MFKKCLQLLKSRGFAVLFGIVLISACSVSAGAYSIEKSGDGFSLYDAVMAPSLPEFNLGELPYCFLSYQFVGPAPDDYLVVLYFSNEEPIYDSLSAGFTGFGWNSVNPDRLVYSYIYVGSENLALQLDFPYSTSWVPIGFTDMTGSGGFETVPVWANFQAKDSTGAYISSSFQDPYDLSGMNCILYSYDSTDSFTSGRYIVSSFLDLPSSAVAVSCVVSNNTFTGNGSFYSDIIVDGSSWYIFSSSSTRLVSSDFTNDTLSLYYPRPVPFVGCPFFAYKVNSESLIDFSDTSLSVSNPEYDYQSAEFDVSWFNLPVVPYPDNVQYFIQGRLNDGAASQPPEIYLGSSSDPPTSDVPVSFSFSGLQPETQYTATFELVYNDTGNFRDFIRSGVTASVSFTTLSDGSISEGDKAIINAIQQGNKDNQQWIDSNMGAAVGDLPEDTTETDSILDNLDEQESEYHADAVNKFNELSSTFQGFDGSVSSGISLVSTLFSRVWNSMGNYVIVYTFPLLLGLALVIIGRVSRVHLPNSGDRIKGKDES